MVTFGQRHAGDLVMGIRAADSTGSACCSAVKNSAKSLAVRRGSARLSTVAVSPGSHLDTDQSHGYPKAGLPTPSGTGIGSGMRGARRGSQKCSFRLTGGPLTARQPDAHVLAEPVDHIV